MIKIFGFVKTKLPGDRGFNAAKCHSFCRHSHCSTFLQDITVLYQLLLEGRGGLFLFNVAAGQRGEKLGSSPLGLCVLFISLGKPSKLSKGFSCAAPDGNPNSGGGGRAHVGSWQRCQGWDDRPPRAPQDTLQLKPHDLQGKKKKPHAMLGQAQVFYKCRMWMRCGEDGGRVPSS